MICCSLVSVYYKEPVALRNSLLLSGGISILFALILGYFTRGPVNLSREMDWCCYLWLAKRDPIRLATLSVIRSDHTSCSHSLKRCQDSPQRALLS